MKAEREVGLSICPRGSSTTAATMSESEKDIETLAGFEFDELLDAVLRERGLMIPVSVQDVKRAEAEIDEQSVRLPESLEDPFAFLHKPRRSKFGEG